MDDDPRQRHPQGTMDDVTSISSSKEIEKVDTIMVSKSMEVRPTVVVAAIAGGIAGGVIAFMLEPLVGMTAAAVVFLAIIAAVVFLTTGTVRDATEEYRWRRALHTLQSHDIEGEVFYVNSLHPENIVDLQEMIIR